MSGRVDAREGLRLGASLPACVRRTASLGNDPVSPAAAAAAEDYDGWARDGTADGGHALAGK